MTAFVGYAIDDDLDVMTAEQLEDWYEQFVGYRPMKDDPDMSEDELLALCLSYQKDRVEG